MSVSGPAAPSTSPVSTAITALRAAAESADGDAVGDLLAPDVVLHSPLTSRIRFEGKDEVAALHRDIFAVIENLSTPEPLTRGDTGAFSFSGHVRGQKLDAMNLVRVNEQGSKIVEYQGLRPPAPGPRDAVRGAPPAGFSETSRIA